MVVNVLEVILPCHKTYKGLSRTADNAALNKIFYMLVFEVRL